MIIDIKDESENGIDIIELKGEVENVELIDCEFDKEKVELHFENFFLAGGKKQDKYTLLERVETQNGPVFRKVAATNEIYFFESPPMYKLAKSKKTHDSQKAF